MSGTIIQINLGDQLQHENKIRTRGIMDDVERLKTDAKPVMLTNEENPKDIDVIVSIDGQRAMRDTKSLDRSNKRFSPDVKEFKILETKVYATDERKGEIVFYFLFVKIKYTAVFFQRNEFCIIEISGKNIHFEFNY